MAAARRALGVPHHCIAPHLWLAVPRRGSFRGCQLVPAAARAACRARTLYSLVKVNRPLARGWASRRENGKWLTSGRLHRGAEKEASRHRKSVVNLLVNVIICWR